MPVSDEPQSVPLGQGSGLGLGERLRSARKARALSVAQVAEGLRLDEASVLALEEERFDILGAPVFVRGHLKRYAQIVGLPTAAVLDAYRAAAPDSDAPPSLARPREQAERLRPGSWVYWVIAAIVLIGIVVSITSSKDETPPQATSVAVPEPGPTVAEPADPPVVEPGLPAVGSGDPGPASSGAPPE